MPQAMDNHTTTPPVLAGTQQEGPALFALRSWLGSLCAAVERYAAGHALPSEPPQFRAVLDWFPRVCEPVALVSAGTGRLTPRTLAALLADAEALEESATAALSAMPGHADQTPQEAAAYAVCLMARGLPFQLRAYAMEAGGLIQ